MAKDLGNARDWKRPHIAYGYFLDEKAKGSDTDSSQAITLNKVAGVITSSTSTLAAATTETITLTNSFIDANSIVMATVDGGGAGDVVLSKVTPSAGSVAITVLNADQANACDAAYKIRFVVI